MEIFIRETDGTKEPVGKFWSIEIISKSGEVFTIDDPSFSEGGITVRVDGELRVIPQSGNMIRLNSKQPFPKNPE